jgi:Peptidase family M1 domain
MTRRLFILFLVLVVCLPLGRTTLSLSASASSGSQPHSEPADDKPAAANSDPTYVELRSAKLSGEAATIDNLVLKRDLATLTLKKGQIYFLAPVAGKVTGGVFLGEGEFELTPLMPIEKRQLSILTGTGSITEQFTKLVLRFTDSTYDEIKKVANVSRDTATSAAQNALDDQRNLVRKGKTSYSQFSAALSLLNYNLDARILMDLKDEAQAGLFHAYFNGKKFGEMLYAIDPQGLPVIAPEEVVLATFGENNHGMWVASHLAEHYRTSAFYDENHLVIDLQHYNIEAAVKGKRLEATVACTFTCNVDGLSVVPFDLYGRLRVRQITDDKKHQLAFIQEDKLEDPDLYVILEHPLKRGESCTLTFDYAGDDAVIDTGGGNFSLVARENWYPAALNSFSDRATFDMTLKTPKGLIMVATGQPAGETQEGDWLVTKWKEDVPIAVAGFNYGKFKKETVQDEKTKYVIESYANRELPDSLRGLQTAIESFESEGGRTETTLGSLNTVRLMDKARAEAQGAIELYTDLFGPLPYGRVAMTQQPFFNFGQAWPMLIFMPLSAYLDSTHKHQLGIDASDSFFKIVGPHEVAHQWWGHVIGWKSYRDQWMSEGFADFSAALFAQIVYKNDLFVKFWKEQRELITQKNRMGWRPADAGSVYMGYRLDTPKTGSITRAMIYPKGGFILHMIRMMMRDPKTGDERFSAMMKEFVQNHYNGNVSTRDFQKAVERHMTKEMDMDGNGKMDWFFNEWVYGSTIPEYKLDYRFEDVPGGKVKIVGTLTQSNVDPSFKMRVPIYLDFDGQIARLGVMSVEGNSSEPFEVGLPKKPKRAMLCYYEDVLCTIPDR